MKLRPFCKVNSLDFGWHGSDSVQDRDKSLEEVLEQRQLEYGPDREIIVFDPHGPPTCTLIYSDGKGSIQAYDGHEGYVKESLYDCYNRLKGFVDFEPPKKG